MNRKLLLLSMTTLILVFGVSQRANAETTICSETGITGTFTVNSYFFHCPDPGKSYYNSNDDYMIVLPNGDFILPWGKIKDFLDIPSLHQSQYNKHIFYFLNDTPYFFSIRLFDSFTIKKDDIEGKQNLIALPYVGDFTICENTKDYLRHYMLNKQVFDFFKERVIHNFKLDETNEKDGVLIWSNQEIIGKYKKGIFVTAEEIRKENEENAAAQAAAQAADAEKALKRDAASFKKKYGFDPVHTGWKAVFKIGRTVSAFNAYNKWLEDHGYKNYTFKLIVDYGTTQCYDLFDEWALTKYGRFWVRNGKISSVAWTR